MIKKVDGWKNNPEKLTTMKIGEHIPCGYSVSIIWTFDGTENKHDVYRGVDWMEKFCESRYMKIINFEKKMILLTSKEYESFLNKKKNPNITFAIKSLKIKTILIKIIVKVREHCHYIGKYRGAAHICNSEYSIPKEILVVFHKLNCA